MTTVKLAHLLVTAKKAPRRILKSLGLMTMVGISANLLAASAAKASPLGNFSATCKNLRLNAADFSKTAMLTADCIRRDKTTHAGAQINLNDVLTINQGRLQWARRPGGGDFQESCRNDFLLQRGSFGAFCRGQPGEGQKFIDLNENIINDNGDLKYIGYEKVIFDTGSPKAAPPSGDPPLKAGPR
jgi:hypothetical protein